MWGDRRQGLLFRGWSRLCFHAASLNAAEAASSAAAASARAVRAEVMQKEAREAAEKARAWQHMAARVAVGKDETSPDQGEVKIDAAAAREETGEVDCKLQEERRRRAWRLVRNAEEDHHGLGRYQYVFWFSRLELLFLVRQHHMRSSTAALPKSADTLPPSHQSGQQQTPEMGISHVEALCPPFPPAVAPSDHPHHWRQRETPSFSGLEPPVSPCCIFERSRGSLGCRSRHRSRRQRGCARETNHGCCNGGKNIRADVKGEDGLEGTRRSEAKG